MEWFQPIDHLKHTIDKSLTFSVVQASEGDFTAEVLIVVRVTTGTTKGALFGDFNGQRGLFTF